MNNTSQDQVILTFVEGLLNMKLTTIGLVLQLWFQIWELQIIKKVLEKVNAFKCSVTYLKNWTHDLTLHLLVDKDDIFLIIDNVTNL